MLLHFPQVTCIQLEEARFGWSIGLRCTRKYTNMQSEAVWIEGLNTGTFRKSKPPLGTEECQVAANYTRHTAFSELN